MCFVPSLKRSSRSNLGTRRRNAMQNRRLFLALSFLLVIATLSDGGRAAGTGPADTIHQFYDALLSTMQQGPTLGPKGRYARLEPVIGETFDLPYMARIVVGPVWTRISAAQQRQMTDAFERYVTATYADRFNSYDGQKLQVTGERPRAADAIVESRIVKADGKAVAIRYLMHQNSGRWRVADVYLDGTVSELATRRSEFSSILQQQGIDGLTAILNRKAEILAEGMAR